MKKVIFFLCCAIHSMANAATIHTLDKETSLDISLSTTSLNRIAFEGGAIVQALFDGNRFATQISPITGELFLTPKCKIESPISLSVITDSGVTQTFQVTSHEGAGEIVMIKEKARQESPIVIHLRDKDPSYSLETLNLLFSGLCPDGYQKRDPIPTDALFCLPDGIQSQLISVIEGPFQRFLVFDLKNGSRKALYVSPNELRGSSKEWLLIARPFLQAKETTRVIAIRSKEEPL